MNKKLHTHASPSPLRLERYFVKSVNFALYKGYDRARLTPDEIIGMEVPFMEIGATCEQNPENHRQWRVEVELKLAEPENGVFPYKIDATLVGYFTVEDKYPEGDAEKLARISGPSLLYSTARDLVDTITGRSAFPAMTLPSVMFSLIGEQEARKELQAGVTPRTMTTKTGRRKIARKAIARKTSKKK